ncbi:hypothetical protein WJX72_008968 [[Myrmecia] bisecta]|uniref:Uncharacterized protein n=1 Tax=[Myrmecia] bisecta TaxID=41462 RepID=A0AAW1PFQ8_9CHLO
MSSNAAPSATACPPSATGGAVCGDPIIVGLDPSHREFELVGVPGACYALISEALHHVNVCLVDAQLANHNRTFIDSVGVLVGPATIAASVNDAGN